MPIVNQTYVLAFVRLWVLFYDQFLTKMASNVSNEKDSLLLKIERQIFPHQEHFDDNFQKNEPPVKKHGMYLFHHNSIAAFHFLILIC